MQEQGRKRQSLAYQLISSGRLFCYKADGPVQYSALLLHARVKKAQAASALTSDFCLTDLLHFVCTPAAQL